MQPADMLKIIQKSQLLSKLCVANGNREKKEIIGNVFTHDVYGIHTLCLSSHCFLKFFWKCNGKYSPRVGVIDATIANIQLP